MHIKTMIALSALILITACSERDRDYYEANIDDAQAKAEECEASMEAAFRTQDEEELESLAKDAECNFAVEVFQEHKRKLARIKFEEQRKEKERVRKEEEKVFEQQYAEQLIALKELPYPDFFSLRKDCGVVFLAKKTPKCKAYADLKDEVETREIDVLKKQYSEGKLEEYRDSSCKGVEYNEAYCGLSRTAARQQKEERVNYYVNNREELKEEFNKCHATYDALRKSKKWQEANESIRTYQCEVVGKAAAKLKVYSFDKPIG